MNLFESGGKPITIKYVLQDLINDLPKVAVRR